ncbi:MAG TPA: YicC family protein [bacterium]|nr:YicC family protein [bacterium]HPQ19600.1 YicC family protein [bacterium]
MKQQNKIISMTGYGIGRYVKNDTFCIAEISSINSKSFDLFLKADESLYIYETKIKTIIQKELVRGRINLVIKTNLFNKGKKIFIDREKINNYILEIKKIKKDFEFTDENLVKILELPDVINIFQDISEEKSILEIIIKTIKKAITECQKMRLKEGYEIWQNLEIELKKIEKNIKTIKKNKDKIVKKYNENFKKKLPDFINKNLDSEIEKRVLLELALYAEKSDITEEITRIESHIKQFREIVKNNNFEKGKVLNFLMQEFLREANTLSAKSNDILITQLAIEIKKSIETIREQILNIL